DIPFNGSSEFGGNSDSAEMADLAAGLWRSTRACTHHFLDKHLPRQPHQRMAKVDDLLETRAKQIVLAIVARLAHRAPRQRISPSKESRTAQIGNPKSQENPHAHPAFLQNRLLAQVKSSRSIEKNFCQKKFSASREPNFSRRMTSPYHQTKLAACCLQWCQLEGAAREHRQHARFHASQSAP